MYSCTLGRLVCDRLLYKADKHILSSDNDQYSSFGCNCPEFFVKHKHNTNEIFNCVLVTILLYFSVTVIDTKSYSVPTKINCVLIYDITWCFSTFAAFVIVKMHKSFRFQISCQLNTFGDFFLSTFAVNRKLCNKKSKKHM